MLSFSVRAGEIVGLAGLMGAGRTEVLESLYGAKGPVAGTITLDGRPYTPRSPRQAIRRGMALVAEDRKSQSLVLDNTVRFNTTLAALDRFLRPWRTVNRRAERAAAAEQNAALGMKTASVETVVSDLSGGNQQKVVLAKCLLTKPDAAAAGRADARHRRRRQGGDPRLMDRLAGDGAAIWRSPPNCPS